MSNRFSPRSVSLQIDPEKPAPLIDALQQDMRTLSRVINAQASVYLTGSRCVVPVSGTIKAYVISDTATAGSTGIAYHTVVVTRSGQSEGQLSIDTRNAEISAYKPLYCGTFNVGVGDLMSMTLAVTGAPAPTLTAANLNLLCVLTPTEVLK
jgi:hypothetical protein